MRFRSLLLCLTCSTFVIFGCARPDSGSTETAPVPPDIAKIDPVNSSETPKPPAGTPSPLPSSPPVVDVPPVAEHQYTTDVLLFNGVGISTSDWQSTEQILKSMGLSYQLVNSTQLTAMSLEQIAKFGLIIVPGGKGGSITSGLPLSTRLRVRQAVREKGVSYLGFCAGAWVAVGLDAETTNSASYGFAVLYGNHLSNWWPNGDTSAIAAVVKVNFADGRNRYLVWWGGPATPEWSGGVVARYQNGKPAISQRWAAKGFVIMTGPHPEAPSGWRGTAGNDPDGLDLDLAKELIRAALERHPLVTF